MNVYFEEIKDVYSAFGWKGRELDSHLEDDLRQISAFCIVGEMLLFPEEIEQFKIKCEELFKNHLTNELSHMRYKLYLIALKQNEYRQTEKIFHYYKLWKALENEMDCSGFTSRIEKLVWKNGEAFYVGISEFNADFLLPAIKLASGYSNHYGIVLINKSEDESSEQLMDKLLEEGINNHIQFDFSKLVPLLCRKHYSVCVWGSSSEEQQLSCFYMNHK
ncbi:hypothetical protein A6395_00540 [Exiguobacterium sp. SH31]|uniref:hypothetical protein n=1 Tax=unclassified Exiguobacterium TaxID=2644629 RepID=UPI0008AE4E1C|nr:MULTISPECIES: hypothetical protein [unclassified Exiguobacterium]OGX80661.1 hypothetical protein A6395_00540 [Exiguobacterium sp. SH31]TCI54074.1 hypothetical protein EVJ24_07165 [Exiguobacterium sp. SH1S21]